VREALEEAARPQGKVFCCRPPNPWMWITGSKRRVWLPPGPAGILGVAKEASACNAFFRTSPDDWWRVVASRVNYVFSRNIHVNCIALIRGNPW